MGIFPVYEGPPLLEQVVSIENMLEAWRQVKGNIRLSQRERSAGADNVTVSAFEADLARQLSTLVEELRGGRYQPQPARRVAIPKGDGRERVIGILTIRDRIVQRALQQTLDPLFDPYLLDCSYGCRRRLNIQQALERVERYAAQGLTYVVDADVAGYFDNIDHGILLRLLGERVRELPTLQLIRKLLEAGVISSAEAGPLSDVGQGGSALLRRGEQLLERLRQAPALNLPPARPYDYEAGLWDDPNGWSPGLGGRFGGQPLGGSSPMSTLWSLYLLLQPVSGGLRRALPHLQRFGVQRLVVAGAAAAGAAVLTELVLRWQQAERLGALQGGALSPLLGNIYLHPFDMALTSRGLRLVRFMDDFVVMCASQGEAERAMELVERQLAVLRLRLNPEKSRIVNYADGLEFLGQALAPPRRGPRPLDGVKSFEEAERALREVSRQTGARVVRQLELPVAIIKTAALARSLR